MNHSKPRRWWLPGPPPPRRLISLDLVEESYRRDGTPELSVPVRSIRVPWVERSSVLAPYLDRSDKPGSAEETPVSGPKYLFHGCGNVLGPRVIQSFARRGPSIRFSRSQSYFSADQAVYWSNSVEFAIAWSFFSETGSWNLNDFDGKRPFRCLIFVSRLDLAEPSFEGGLYLIPRPQSPEEEAELGDWCDANRTKMAQTRRIPPPKSQKADWGVIGSRIPKDTMRALRPLYNRTDKTWLFAACNEASSRTIAGAGVEILHITLQPRNQMDVKL
ncbi:hypothetical protein BKA56DRAFT_570156 [Ilyonectria sp. MPI-CAGE-AT-0026]|nr:hypothetical protein BKA56DRAFT_570156 [Ilyonectria sp. MPI-CAGE-AT-0026]